MQLRPYQQRAIDELIAAVRAGSRRPLLVAPTGAGKTAMFSALVSRHLNTPGNRVLFLAHRKELLTQAADAIESTGVRTSIIAPSSRRFQPHARVQVASIQTLLAREQRPTATLIMVDEAHHIVSDEWRTIVEAYPNVHVVGATATPERGDGRGLGEMFDRIIVASTVKELTELGFLVPCEIVRPAKMLASGEIAQRPVDAYNEHAKGRQAIVFCQHVMAASHAAVEFENAAVVTADTPDRARILAEFKAGKIQVLVNVFVLTEGFDHPPTSCVILARGCGTAGTYLQMCLDEKTEILTRRGFLGPDEIRADDEVAAVDLSAEDPTMHWETPSAIIDRPMSDDETMVGIDSPRLDIRCTDQHTVFHRHRIKGGTSLSRWLSDTAASRMVAPGHYEIPASAVQDADGVSLSDAELRLIGWFVTDGSISRGNRQLKIYQAEDAPFVPEIHRCLVESGLRYGVHRRERVEGDGSFANGKPILTFSVSHGMPRKLSERAAGLSGYAHLEKYMDKDMSPLLDGMSARQIAIFLEALHWGDGAKQVSAGQTWTRCSFHIGTNRRLLADRLQSLCLRRGWSCNVSTEHRESGPFFFVRAKQTFARHVGGSTSSDRPSLKTVDHAPAERVWCVSVSTGAIMVRRNGKACVLGNCGRVLRPAPGKKDALLIDLRGVSHVHGEPDEDRIYSLTGRAIRRADENEDDATLCRVCGAIRTGPVCECGISNEQELPTIVNSPLVKYARMRAMDEADRVRTLAKWMRDSESKGYKPGHALAKYRAVFGAWPSWPIRNKAAEIAKNEAA